jgi:hypothetical protein
MLIQRINQKKNTKETTPGQYLDEVMPGQIGFPLF